MKAFFTGRWVSQLVLAIGFFAFAAFSYDRLVRIEAGKAGALAQGVPEAVSLAEFQGWSDIHPADEVHIIAKTILPLNYRLEMTRKGKLSSRVEERMVYFLFGPDEAEGTRTVRAALLIDSADLDRWFAQELSPGLVSSSETEVVMRLNGQKVTNPDLKSMAEDAMAERGLTRAPEFFFMESWGPKGRAAALGPDPNAAIMMGGGIGGVGLIFLMVAIWRFARRHRVLARQAVLARQVEEARAAMAATYRAQGLAVPEALTMPLKPRKSRGKLVVAVLLGGVVVSVGLAKLGYLDDALFALPVLLILLVILGLRYLVKLVSGGVARLGGAVARAGAPQSPEAPPAPKYGPNFKPLGLSAPIPDSPVRVSDTNLPEPAVIRSVPSLGGRVSTALSAPGLIKWAPLAIGVGVMYVSGKLFGGLGLSGLMGTAGMPVAQAVTQVPAPAAATQVQEAATALPQVLDLGNLSVEGMVVVCLGIAVAMALVGYGLNLMVSRYAARRNIDYPNDPWARLDRMTAAERARG
ncbi:MAG: hypothetical protein ACK4VZ_15645 [Paracoccaceae bacterium]